MSFFRPTGGGATLPVAPTISLFERKNQISNGSNPQFIVTFSGGSVAGKSPKHPLNGNSIYYYVDLFKTSDNSLVAFSTGGTSSPITTTQSIAAGTSYYAKVRIVDGWSREVSSSASSSIIAMTRPGNVGTVTLTGGTNTLSGSWTAVNNGGDSTNLVYDYVVKNASTLNTYTTGTATVASFSLTSVPAATYFAEVTARNSYDSSTKSTSANATVVAPPFFPFFPSFGPFFPFFPFFPSFGPFFPSFGGGGGFY